MNTLQETLIDITTAGYEAMAKGDDADSEFVDRAIELQKQRAEIDDQLDVMKASLRLQYIKTGVVKLLGTKGTIMVSVPKDCDPYVDDDFDVVYDTNGYLSSKLLKLVNRLVAKGKVSRSTVERCRSEGTRKLSLSFPKFK